MTRLSIFNFVACALALLPFFQVVAVKECSFQDIYPRQYVAHKLAKHETIKLDGHLDDSAWLDAPFTENFVDISTSTKPQYNTKAKIRYDDDFLYVGVMLEDPHIWANISSTCHCISDSDQVIFHDDDFEIFVDAAGSNHFYKVRITLQRISVGDFSLFKS